MRFTAASDKLMKQDAGVLGLADMAAGQDFTAVGVKKASLKIMTDLCLGNQEVPFSDTGILLAPLTSCLASPLLKIVSCSLTFKR